jgi:hypothetical protein
MPKYQAANNRPNGWFQTPLPCRNDWVLPRVGSVTPTQHRSAAVHMSRAVSIRLRPGYLLLHR